MAAATEVIRRSMSTLSGLFTKKLPTGIWQFTFDEVGKGMKYVVNGRRYEFMAINGVMGITIDATQEKQLWYVISDDCTVQIEEVGQSANPFHSIPHLSGTWTPVLTLTTPGDLAITYDTQLGGYYIIGDRVFIDITLDLASFANATGSGSWKITGLPFVSNDNGLVNVGNAQTSNINYTTALCISATLNPDSVNIYLTIVIDDAAMSLAGLTNAVIDGSSKINISLNYKKA
jgi:hypothetical protein